jgi:hypothetical protein
MAHIAASLSDFERVLLFYLASNTGWRSPVDASNEESGYRRGDRELGDHRVSDAFSFFVLTSASAVREIICWPFQLTPAAPLQGFGLGSCEGFSPEATSPALP